MRAPLIPARRLLMPVAVLTGPAALVLVALALAGYVPWLVSIAATAAVGGVLLAIVYRHLQGLEALRQQVDDLLQDRQHKAGPALPLGTAAELSAGIAALGARWAARDRELKAGATMSAAVLDSVPDPLILLDETRAIRRINAAARDLLGEGLAGRDIDSVLRDPAILEAVDEVYAGRAAEAAQLTMPGAVERHFDVRAVRLPDQADERPSVLLALYDVTAIRRAEQMRADFVANVSHELRTPLSTLLGFIETLRGPARDDPEARERFLAIMHDQASRMSRLVRDLLSLSKIEETEHTPPTGRVAIAGVINGVVDALMLQAKAKGIALVTDLPADLPEVVGDPDQIAQVFQNLIDNAVKYGRPNTKVRIAARVSARPPGPRPDARSAGPALAVAVGDEGEGIPREHLPRLTERFYRIDAGRSRQLGGTGLGLAIVKHIVNRHRGVLTIDSEVGRGSVFTVYLPAASPSG